MYQLRTDSDSAKAPSSTQPVALPYVAMGLSALRRRSWLICAITVACMIAAISFAFLAPPRFVATTQLVLDPNELRAVDNVLRVPNQFNDSHIAQIESQVRVLVSDSVIRRVVTDLKLVDDKEFVDATGAGQPTIAAVFRSFFGSPPSESRDHFLIAMRALKRRIASKRIERTYVVEITVWTRDPDKSVRISSSLIEAFLAEQASARAEAARRVSASLSTRLGELQARVQEADQRVHEYKKAHGILQTGGQLVNEQQLTELNRQLVNARTRTADMKARYEQIRDLQGRNLDPGAMKDAVDSGTISALRTQFGEVVQREGELTAVLGARHPAVAAVRSQANQLRQLIREEVVRIGEAARNDLERAEASENALARTLGEMKHSLESTNEFSMRLRELERDLAASRTVYEAFLVRTREIKEQERLDTSNVRIISPPEQPEHRSWPPRTLLLALAGLVLGLCLSVAWVLFETQIATLLGRRTSHDSLNREQPLALTEGSFSASANENPSGIAGPVLSRSSVRGARA